jgi:hypothetical protein
MNKVLKRDIYVNIIKKYENDSRFFNFPDSGSEIPEDGYGYHQLNISVLIPLLLFHKIKFPA